MYSRGYRYFWLSAVISFGAVQMQQVARAFLARDLTSSPLLVTSVFALGTLPMLVTPLLGGYLADRKDRRKLLIILEVLQMVVTVVMALLVTFDSLSIPILMGMSILTGGIMGASFPVRQSMIPDVTDKDSVTNGLVLFTGGFSTMQIASPAVGGILIGVLGPESPFFAALGIYIVGFSVLLRVPGGTAHVRPSSRSFIEDVTGGFLFVRRNPVLLVLMASAAIGTILTIPIMGLLPIFQRDVLDVGPGSLGLMLAAFGVGAVIASAVMAVFSPERPKATIPIVFAMLTGLALTVFSQSSSFGLSLLFLVVIGMAQAAFMTLSMAIVQMLATGDMLGRVVAIRMVVFGLIPIGQIGVGLGAEFTSPQTALAVMGLAAAGLQVVMLLWLRRVMKSQGAALTPSGTSGEPFDRV